MTTKYYAILTNLGAAKLANATALGGRLQITHMAMGDGGGVLPTPNASQTALVGERRRAPLNSLSIDASNDSQIIAEQVIPENEGGWWIREIGLFDADGVMVAVANCAETYKPLLQEGSGRTQTVRMILIVNSTDAVTLKIDPAVVLATRKYVEQCVIEVRSYVDQAVESVMVEVEKKASRRGDSNQDFSVSGGNSQNSAVAYCQFQSGNNGHGAWTKMPGGAQWCRAFIYIPANTNVSWTFPAAFPGYPGLFFSSFDAEPKIWFNAVSESGTGLYNGNNFGVNVNVLAMW